MASDSPPELEDEALAEEIRLLGDLVLAASNVPRHLTQDEVDQVLGLGRPDRSQGGPSETQGRPAC